jgi:hypothetical protein
MNIKEFFQHRVGTWSSQRTSHDPVIKKSESRNSVIQVEIAPIADLEVIELCQRHNFTDRALCALKINWKGAIEKENIKGSTLLIAIADESADLQDEIQQGKLLQQQSGEKSSVVGRYVMEANDVLSLVTDHGSLIAEEKIWFPRPNICMRASHTKGSSEIASFCTEIRKVESPKV